ncbi:MAG: F0F1 ATP synthase subunit delta [Chloroflexota bacterium]
MSEPLGAPRAIPQVATGYVRTATALTAGEQERLQRALERYTGQPVALRVELDPTILGGMWVRVGDIVMDGSLRGRLEELRRHLCARCRVMGSGDVV